MQPNGVPRYNPYLQGLPPPPQIDNLPFRTKHAVCSVLQKIIEEVLFYWADREVKYFLLRTSWDAVEAAELSEWANALRSKLHPQHREDVLDRETTRLLEKVRFLRHAAVHRAHVSLLGAEIMCQDAIKLAVRFQDDLRTVKLQFIQHALHTQDAEEIERILQSPLEQFRASLVTSELSKRKVPLVRPIERNIRQQARYPLPNNGQVASIRRRSHSPVRQEALGSGGRSRRRPRATLKQRKMKARKAKSLPVSIVIDLTGNSDDEAQSKIARGRTLADAIDLTIEPAKLEVQAENDKWLSILEARESSNFTTDSLHLKPDNEDEKKSLRAPQVTEASDRKGMIISSPLPMPVAEIREQFLAVPQANTRTFRNEAVFGIQSVQAPKISEFSNAQANKGTAVASKRDVQDNQVAFSFPSVRTVKIEKDIVEASKVVQAVQTSEVVFGIPSMWKPKLPNAVQLNNDDKNKRTMQTPKGVLQAVRRNLISFRVPSTRTPKTPESRYMNYGFHGSNLPGIPTPSLQSLLAVNYNYDENDPRV